MNRNNEKKRDKQRYSPKNENDIERWKWMCLKIFLEKLGGMGVRVRRGWTRGDTGTYVPIKQWKPSPPMAYKPLHHKENRRFSQKPWLFSVIKHYSTKAFYQAAAPKNRDAFSPTCRADSVPRTRRFCGRRLFTFCCICNKFTCQSKILDNHL